MANDNIISCAECGCPYSANQQFCPECGHPNTNRNVSVGSADIRGYATSCPNCGAPANGLRNCEWCGSVIPYIGSSVPNIGHGGQSNNLTILECEFRRVVTDRNAYPYIICHVSVHGRELLQLCDFSAPQGIELRLLNIGGLVMSNFSKYIDYHTFIRRDGTMYTRSFGVDFRHAAQIANAVLTQVYEVTNEQVSCDFEYGQNQSQSDNTGNTVAAVLGGVLLGSLLGD